MRFGSPLAGGDSTSLVTSSYYLLLKASRVGNLARCVGIFFAPNKLLTATLPRYLVGGSGDGEGIYAVTQRVVSLSEWLNYIMQNPLGFFSALGGHHTRSRSSRTATPSRDPRCGRVKVVRPFP